MKKKGRLEPISFEQVKIRDAFWAPRMETNGSRTLPAIYRQLKKTGRIDAFKLKFKSGPAHRPHIFWDSDVAKWIEGMSYAMALEPDRKWLGILQTVVQDIATAQQPDGYLNIYFTALEPKKRWTNLRDAHELYCAGHLIEAAVAHKAATGSKAFLEVVRRYADHIGSVFGRGKGKLRGYPGHQEIELALIRLYRATGEARYLGLAEYFINERGRKPLYFDREARARGEDPRAFRYGSYAYNQSHLPVRAQEEAVGHAVRAFYMYSAMADLALENGDPTLMGALKALWESACLKRMYITGGAGTSSSNEGFTADHDLPEKEAYAETCASVALVFFNHRMLQIKGEGRYADVMEQALYNGALSGVSLEGERFFYANPMAREGIDAAAAPAGKTTWDGATYGRREWFGCACCPTNLARLIASLGGYIYSKSDRGVWIHLYAAGATRVEIRGNPVALEVKTRYPWHGRVTVTVNPEQATAFSLNLRMPGWCRNGSLEVNGRRIVLRRIVKNGYARIDRTWKSGDRVVLELAMPVERIRAHPAVKDTMGKVALKRGPIVYCLEEIDNPGVPLERVVLPSGSRLRPVYKKALLGGVSVVKGRAHYSGDEVWKGMLYSPDASRGRTVEITAVPYCVWDNRGPGAMRIWLHGG